MESQIWLCGSFSDSTIDIINSYNKNDADFSIKVAQIPVNMAKVKIATSLNLGYLLKVIVDTRIYEVLTPHIENKVGANKVYLYKDDNTLKANLIEWYGDPNEAPATNELISEVDTVEIPMDFSAQLMDKDAEISSLKEKLAQAELMTDELSRRLKEKSADDSTGEFVQRIKELGTELSQKDEEIERIKGLLNDAQNKVQELESQKSSLSSADAEKLAALQQELEATKAKLQAELEDKARAVYATETSSDELFTANAKITTLTQKVEACEEEKAELTSQLTEAQAEAERKQVEIERLNAEVSAIKAESDSNSDAKAQLEEALTNNKNLQVDVEAKENTIKELEAKVDEAKGYVETITLKDSEIRAKDEVIQGLEAKVLELTPKADLSDTLTSDLNLAKAQLAEKDDIISTKQAELTALNQTNDDLVQQIASAHTEQAKLQNNLELVTQQKDTLDAELISVKATNAELQTANTTLKQDLVAKETKLKTAQKIADSKSDAVALKRENEVLQGKVAMLESEVANSSVGGIFKDLANESNYPTGVSKLCLDTLIDVNKDQFLVVAPCSSDSIRSLETVLKATFKTIKKSFVVLDLSVDATIDGCLSVPVTKSLKPILTGESLVPCLSDTAYPNVKYLGFGGQYVNEIGLLSLDWRTIFSELTGLADEIIINVGNLTSTVPRILFTTFGKGMPAQLVLRCSPSSIRACLLTLKGMRHRGIITQCNCAEYDNNNSSVRQWLLQLKTLVPIRQLKIGDGLVV